MSRLPPVLLISLAVVGAGCADQAMTQSSNPAGPSSAVAAPGDLAAKPPSETTQIPGTVTFSDRPADGIRSDGGGTYVHGGQLEVGFYTASEDFVLKGRGRVLTFQHPALGTSDSGSFTFMNIRGILDMDPGEIRSQVVAVFQRSSDNFRFNPAKYPGTTYVTVVRDLSGVWTVTADSPANAALTTGPKDKVLGIYDMPFQVTAQCVTASLCP